VEANIRRGCGYRCQHSSGIFDWGVVGYNVQTAVEQPFILLRSTKIA
jgi:hypothetical protein